MDIVEDSFSEPGKASYLGMKLPTPRGTQSWEAASILKTSATNEIQRRLMQLDRVVQTETRERRLRLRNQLLSIPTTLANRFDYHATFAVFEFLVKGKFQVSFSFDNGGFMHSDIAPHFRWRRTFFLLREYDSDRRKVR